MINTDMGLKLLREDDFYNVQDFNDNFDALETAHNQLRSDLASQAANVTSNAVNLTSHTGRRDNPHGVTPAQVGGTANLTTVTQAIAEAGTDTTVRGWTSQAVRQGAVAAFPTVTQAIAESGTDTAVRGWTSQRVRQAANAAFPAVTQAVAEAGTDTEVKGWTPQRVRQAVNAAFPAVTQAIAESGTDTTVRGWTSQRVRQSVNAAIASLTSSVAELTQRVDSLVNLSTVTGTMTANGTVTLGFRPRWVYVSATTDYTAAGTFAMNRIFRSFSAAFPGRDTPYLSVTDTGFTTTGMSGQLTGMSSGTTDSSNRLQYVAFK